MLGVAISLLVIGILLLVSAFFAAAESSLFSLNRLRLHKFENSPSTTEQQIAKALSRPKRLIIDIIIWNNVVNIIASSLATVVALTLFGNKGMAIAIGVMTLFLLVFGEILPKTFAVHHSEAVSRAVIHPLRFLSFIATPIRYVFFHVSEWIINLIGKAFNLQRPDLTEDELKTIIEVSEKEGVLDPAEKEMISGVLDFSDTTVGDIMTPRVDVIAINSNWPHAKVHAYLKKHYIAKVPIYDGTVDKVVGMLHSKDLLLNPTKNFRAFIRPILMVPESKKIHLLLNEFKLKNAKIAAVLDEYGGTAGIVTLEDLLEEIFGEIHDEFEEEVKEIVKLDDGTYHLLGRAHLDDVNERMKSHFPTHEYNTLNGLLLGIAGKLPKSGDVLMYKGWKFIVEKISRRRVLSASVVKVKHK